MGHLCTMKKLSWIWKNVNRIQLRISFTRHLERFLKSNPSFLAFIKQLAQICNEFGTFFHWLTKFKNLIAVWLVDWTSPGVPSTSMVPSRPSRLSKCKQKQIDQIWLWGAVAQKRITKLFFPFCNTISLICKTVNKREIIRQKHWPWGEADFNYRF